MNKSEEGNETVTIRNGLKAEGSESVTICNQLKMQFSDGKFYKTDVADSEQLFRLIQSIPSPKAEPFKLWLAEIARERLEETQCEKMKTN